MKRRIYINFTDLSEEKQDEIMDIARNNILEEENEEEIIAEYGEDKFFQVLNEKAEQELNNMTFIFNV